MVSREHEIALVLVSKVRLFRDCMKAVLDNHKNLRIALDTKSLLDLFNMERPPQADVIIAEDTQLGDDKIKALKTLIKKYPRSKTLLICFGTDEDILLEYLNVGVYGYLTMDSGLSDLYKAIDALQKGEHWIERKITSKLIKKNRLNGVFQDTVGKLSDKGFSKREKEVLDELQKGLTSCCFSPSATPWLRHIPNQPELHRVCESKA